MDDKIIIIREKLIENRKKYFVEYIPADDRSWLAFVNLTYITNDWDSTEVIKNMNEEFEYWITKYQVPLSVTAFDAAEDLITVKDDTPSLNGYIDLNSEEIISKWDCLKNDQFPEVQKCAEYQKKVYKDLPCKEFNSTKAGEELVKNARNLQTSINIYASTLILFPIIVGIISMGINWFNWMVIILGWGHAIYKICKLYGYIKPSQNESAIQEKNLKKEHYYYHCEKNPDGFERLRSDNFRKDIIQSNLNQFK